MQRVIWIDTLRTLAITLMVLYHLTFDLADASRMSLSFYGKRPGPGMRLDKLSMQFAMGETSWIGDVLEAYERLILDAMRGDHTLFNTAEGIERLWTNRLSSKHSETSSKTTEDDRTA